MNFNIIAEIPAREGSKRIIKKNLRSLNGKPMISYAIEAAKTSKYLNNIYVNSDSDEIGEYGKSLGVKYYKRKKYLGEDNVTSDEYNYDFIKNTNPDILVQINPVCPLITGLDIDNIIEHFIKNDFDSLITVREEKLQSFCNNKPINFNINKKLPRTQDINPIQICAWPVCVWKADKFIKNYEDKGHAVFGGNLNLYPVSFFKSLKISYEEDFGLVEKILYINNINK
jgi:CMP-N-acetylneuraminic acid synthetase